MLRGTVNYETDTTCSLDLLCVAHCLHVCTDRYTVADRSRATNGDYNSVTHSNRIADKYADSNINTYSFANNNQNYFAHCNGNARG